MNGTESRINNNPIQKKTDDYNKYYRFPTCKCLKWNKFKSQIKKKK